MLNLYTVSGRLLIPGTRVVCTVRETKVLAADLTSAAKQMIPHVEHQIRKDHAKDLPRLPGSKKTKSVRLTVEFMKMNLRFSQFVRQVSETAVTIPSMEEQEKQANQAALLAANDEMAVIDAMDAAEAIEAAEIETLCSALSGEVE